MRQVAYVDERGIVDQQNNSDNGGVTDGHLMTRISTMRDLIENPNLQIGNRTHILETINHALDVSGIVRNVGENPNIVEVRLVEGGTEENLGNHGSEGGEEGGENIHPGYWNGTDGDDTYYCSDSNTCFDGIGGNDSLTAMGENSTLIGGLGDDVLLAADGRIIDGGEGNDLIGGVGSGATIISGSGDDTVYYFSGLSSDEGYVGAAVIDGGDGDDEIYGYGSDNSIIGGAGDDKLHIAAVSDHIVRGDVDGGDGNDEITGGNGDDRLYGNAGSDTIYGNAGNDYISGDGTTLVASTVNGKIEQAEGVVNSLSGSGGSLVSQAGIGRGSSEPTGRAETSNGDITAQTSNHASSQENVSQAKDTGNSGGRSINATYDDVIYAGEGNDTVDGGLGEDKLFGEAGNDRLYGGDGADKLDGGAGADYIDGGEGIDYLYYTGSSEGVYLNLLNNYNNHGGDAQGDYVINVEYVTGSAHNDTLKGTHGEETLSGGAGDDWIYGNGGADVIHGGAGNDALKGGAGDDYITGGAGRNRLDGHGGNDTLIGGDERDVLYGGAGDDVIHTGNGDNGVIGGDGDDTVYGGNNTDHINGGAGADYIDGGAGIDRVFYTQSNAAVNVNLITNNNHGGDAEGDVLTNVEFVGGSNYDDTIKASQFGDDTIRGNMGDDSIRGGAGDNNLIGDYGDDTIKGHKGNDILEGAQGNDIIKGGKGSDIIDGGEGDDRIFGNLGADTLTGGQGADVFVFKAGHSTMATWDVITDFEQGVDLIDIHTLGYESIADFSLITSTLSSGAITTYLFDAESDLKIAFDGVGALTDADFIFS